MIVKQRACDGYFLIFCRKNFLCYTTEIRIGVNLN